jgi:hypothetical protein
MGTHLWVLLVLAAPGGTAWGQIREGSEFRVNAYTTGNQRLPAVASDAAGNFIVVWESVGQDGDNHGVFGQRYAASGVPRGGEFQVNSHTTGFQKYASVASDANGNVIVV